MGVFQQIFGGIWTDSPNANCDTSFHLFECSQKYSDNNACTHPNPTPLPSPLRRAVFFPRLVSGHVYEVRIADHRSCPSENQNTSVILPRRWSSYVIWFVLHIRVEVLVAQVNSYGGIDEGNSSTSCSVWIVERDVRKGIAAMVSLTNNLKFSRLNWKHTCQLSRFSRESPSFSWNLPVSRLEHQISRELPTVDLFAFLIH